MKYSKKAYPAQIIFFTIVIILSVYTILDLTKNVGTVAPNINIVSVQTQSVKLSDDIYVNLQYNGNFSEFYGANISKDDEKIILLDSDIAETRDYFEYHLSEIKTSSDILPVMIDRTGYLLNNQLSEDMQLEEMTITDEKEVISNNMVLNKYFGFFKTSNDQNLNFLCFSFFKNEKPCYMLILDLTEEQSLDLSKYLVAEN